GGVFWRGVAGVGLDRDCKRSPGPPLHGCAGRGTRAWRGVAPLPSLRGLVRAGLVATHHRIDPAGRLHVPTFAVYDPVAALALVAVVPAAAAAFWEEPGEQGLPQLQLYLTALAGIGLVLHTAALSPLWLLWHAALAGAAFVVLAAAVCRLCIRYRSAAEVVGIRPRPAGWPLGWVVPLQAALAMLLVPFAVWIALRFNEIGDRLGGFWIALCCAAAGVLMTRDWQRLTRGLRPLGDDFALPRFLSLLAAALACVLLHIAWVRPETLAVWLHRSVLVMAALTWVALGYGLLLPRLLKPASGWASAARSLATPLGVAACACLGLVLVQEFALYNPNPEVRRTPLALSEVVLVSVALAFLIGGAL